MSAVLPSEARSLLEHVVDSQRWDPYFNAPAAPSEELTGNSKEWRTIRVGDHIERHLKPERTSDFDRRMDYIVGQPISRLSEKTEGVYTEPFLEGTHPAGSVEHLVDDIRAAAVEYNRLPVTGEGLALGRLAIGRRAVEGFGKHLAPVVVDLLIKMGCGVGNPRL